MEWKCSPSLRRNAMYVRRNERRALEKKWGTPESPIENFLEIIDEVDPDGSIAMENLERVYAAKTAKTLEANQD